MTDKDATIANLLNDALAVARQAESEAKEATSPAEARAAAHDIEQAAIEITSVFEARMQHHFKRGPFFKELQKRMGGDDARITQYYHAINVLKHGHGKSHRELLKMKKLPFRVRQHDRNDSDIGLVDVLSPGFFDGLIETLTQAYQFLEHHKDDPQT